MYLCVVAFPAILCPVGTGNTNGAFQFVLTFPVMHIKLFLPFVQTHPDSVLSRLSRLMLMSDRELLIDSRASARRVNNSSFMCSPFL